MKRCTSLPFRLKKAQWPHEAEAITYRAKKKVNINNLKTITMIVYKVIYTIKESFVKRNQENISAFIADFKTMDKDSFRYNIYQSGDKKTFTHISHFKDAGIQNAVLNVPSFVSFQKERDASDLEVEPSIEEIFPLDGTQSMLD